jgi:predicted GNAT family acetyltransferase
MRVLLLPDAATFLERTRSFRTQEPYLTNVVGSTATSVASGQRTYESTSWRVVEDSSGVVGMMMRTAPHHLVLSPMPLEAVGPAVDSVLQRDPQVSGALGSKTLCESFLSLYVARSKHQLRCEVGRDHFVYVLNRLVAPSSVAGSVRKCDVEDFEQLITWWRSFTDEAGLERYGLEEGLSASLAEGRVYVWMVEARPVCAVAHSPVVATPGDTVARIGPVYTPPRERRRGYAAQLTYAVSSLLIDQGHGLMLFTDAANPTSNGVYRRLGYEKVDEMVECILVPA